jgi:hypothetical protein
MKNQNTSSSQNEELVGTGTRRHLLRWAAWITTGLTLAAAASISLNSDILLKSLNLADEVEDELPTAPISSISPDEASVGVMPTIRTKYPPSRQVALNFSGGIPRDGGARANLDMANLDAVPESANLAGDTDVAVRNESSESPEVSSTSEQNPSSTEQTSLGGASAPAIGAVRTIRPIPTPTPTPDPIRSPQ